jgi:hypothetical protein
MVGKSKTPKPKPKPKSKSKKIDDVVDIINKIDEPSPLEKYFQRLNDPNKFVLVKNEYMKDLPIQTHIGYVYLSSKGDLLPVISAFIQSHYVSEGGLGGMMIKCGNRVYANLYKSIAKIYIYKSDYEKVRKTMHYNKLVNPPRPSPEEMAIRIQQLEKTLKELTTKLTRSTSIQQIAEKPVVKVTKKKTEKRPTSYTHGDKKKSKPVKF